MRTIYSLRLQGKTVGGLDISNTITNVTPSICSDQTVASAIARKIEKLYDTGATISSVSLVQEQKYDTSE